MLFYSVFAVGMIFLLAIRTIVGCVQLAMTFPVRWYSTSQEICTRFCYALLCCGYAIVHNEFT